MVDTTRYNTGNELGSNKLEDLSDNAKNIDNFSNSGNETFTDRLGISRRTIAGMESDHIDQINAHEIEHDNQIARHESEFITHIESMGWTPASGSFQAGGTITDRNQTLYDEVSHVFYAWGGALPKVVTAGSTPATSGGIGVGAWSDKTDLMLRTELATSSGPSLIGFKQGGVSSVLRSVEYKLKEQAVNMLDFYNPADGADYYPALTRAIAAIRTNTTSSRILLIPYSATYWPVSQSVLFNTSNLIVLIYGNIKLTATTRQKTLLFSYDTNQQPAAMLENITVIGNGAVIDGNAAAMTFTYAHGDGSDNDSSIRFNYVRGVYVRGLHATNGPIDSFSLRQCQNWVVEKCEFSNSKEDNGFSATTEFMTHVDYNWQTYGYGWAINCVAHGNMDVGMTAYDCGGVTFQGCQSYENGCGFSYEDDFSNKNAKRYEGLFSNCIAYNNLRDAGFYIDASSVIIDDTCKTYNNTSVEDDPFALHGHGVTVSTATDVYVGGFHKGNQKSGLAIFNGHLAGTQMDITVSGEYSSNKNHGIFARGISTLVIKPGTRIQFNGLSLVNGEHGKGIYANNYGYGYLPYEGNILVDGVYLSDNGAGAICASYMKNAVISDCFGLNNLTTENGIAVDIHNTTTASLSNNRMFSSSAGQLYAYAIEASVTNGYDINNTGDGTTGVLTNLASAAQRSARNQLIVSTTYDAASLAPNEYVTFTIPVSGVSFGDFAIASFASDIRGVEFSAWVSASNTVTVRLKNETTGAVDLPPGEVSVMVIKKYA